VFVIYHQNPFCRHSFFSLTLPAAIRQPTTIIPEDSSSIQQSLTGHTLKNQPENPIRSPASKNHANAKTATCIHPSLTAAIVKTVLAADTHSTPEAAIEPKRFAL
jgi:hypothetical protein